jgi:hypothetical protein
MIAPDRLSKEYANAVAFESWRNQLRARLCPLCPQQRHESGRRRRSGLGQWETFKVLGRGATRLTELVLNFDPRSRLIAASASDGC